MQFIKDFKWFDSTDWFFFLFILGASVIMTVATVAAFTLGAPWFIGTIMVIANVMVYGALTFMSRKVIKENKGMSGWR